MRLRQIHEHESRYSLPALLDVSWLLARGWSRRMVERFAGTADAVAANPRAPGRPMRFFLKSRIEEIESTPEFAIAKAAAGGRRKSAKIRNTSTKDQSEIVQPKGIVREKFLLKAPK